MSSPHAYQWIGERLADGRPLLHLGNSDIPDTDLSPDWLAAATPEQIQKIDAYPDLYAPMSEKEWAEHTAPEPQPKWYQSLEQKAETAGIDLPPRQEGETERQYTDRVQPENLLNAQPSQDATGGSTPAGTSDTAGAEGAGGTN